MFTTYGQASRRDGSSPLNAHYSDKSLTDLGWYDEGDLLKTARAFRCGGTANATPAESLQSGTLFINGDGWAQEPAGSPDF